MVSKLASTLSADKKLDYLNQGAACPPDANLHIVLAEDQAEKESIGTIGIQLKAFVEEILKDQLEPIKQQIITKENDLQYFNGIANFDSFNLSRERRKEARDLVIGTQRQIDNLNNQVANIRAQHTLPLELVK